MRRCAFLTTDRLEGFVTYDGLLHEPLARRGWAVDEVPWRTATDWDAYEVVVIRSPWDYQHAPDAFLAVLETIDRSKARLENPLDLVRWNLRKTYLRDLEARGLPIVPTRWLPRLSPADLAPLYARTDFVRLDSGFALMEVELIEPSLYFSYDADSPERFAEAFVARHSM